ncbi:MAG: hypothetical protein IJ222_03430 [Bacteroidales bacterium]|nr:hypothetical protein [Bacteroidales bacterium]
MSKKIKNPTVFAIVAKMLGREKLAGKSGSLELSDEERARIATTYGKDFLAALEGANLSGDADAEATSIFDSMISAAQAQAAQLAERDSTIAQLQATVSELAASPEPTPAAAAVTAPARARKASVNMAAKHNAAATNMFNAENPVAVAVAAAENGVDVSELNAELDIAMPAGVRLDILNKRIYNGFKDAEFFTRIQSNTNYRASAAIWGEVSQQFTPYWTPKGTGKFTPIEIKQRRHKINVAVKPAEILTSWLLFLYEQGKTQAEMPFVKYVIENHILPKVSDDITLSMLGKGKFVEVTDAADGKAGSAASASMDGYETMLVEGRNDPKCKFNYFKAAKNFKDLDAKSLLEYVNSFVDAIKPLFAGRLDLHCSPEFLTAYKRADFAVNGKYTGEENDGRIRFTRFTLSALESMYGSPILFATPRENFVMLVDLSKPERCINKIAEENYDVKIFGEYSLAVGFRIQEAVYAAVPAGYDPKDSIATSEVDTDLWENGKGEDENGEGA